MVTITDVSSNLYSQRGPYFEGNNYYDRYYKESTYIEKGAFCMKLFKPISSPFIEGSRPFVKGIQISKGDLTYGVIFRAGN